MLSVAEARARILALMPVMGAETVPLERAAGRVLAEPLSAARTQPPFDAAAMDGYAVRNADAAPGARLHVIGTSRAGARFTRAGARFNGILRPGEAVRIFTGAPVPPGADAVLIQEDAEAAGDTITVRANRDTQAYIRPAGQDFSAGDTFPATGRLRAADIALLAAMNHAAVPVRRRPVVALIPTGDELVLPGQDPGPDQIVSSNNYGLAAMLEAAGAQARLLPIARDDPAAIDAVLALARDADLIVTLGGASVGDHDLVRSTAEGAGLTLDFHRIAMRPGKPLMSGRLGDTALVGLPGNPVSAMACGAVFLVPAVRAALGLAPKPQLVTARLAAGLPANGPREHYMRAALSQNDAGRKVDVFERQDSALLTVLQAANALVLRPPGAPAAPAGERVDVLPLAGGDAATFPP
ncbi:MAG: gephyrin-like molybdotransferase Glp [Pseudomonadota bacterium]